MAARIFLEARKTPFCANSKAKAQPLPKRSALAAIPKFSNSIKLAFNDVTLNNLQIAAFYE
jgi:hypothetical protein